MSAGRALRQLPFVAEEIGEEVVAPLRRGRGPDDFQTAADGVSSATFAEFIVPTQALLLDVGTFWFGAYILSRHASAMRLAEGMTSGNEGDGFFIIHRHAGESFPNVPGRSNRIGFSIRPLRIHINQAHLHGSERI